MTPPASTAAANTPAISPELISEHGLSHDEYQTITEILGRHPNVVELGIFSVMWSEHCSYKTTRKWLSQLPTTGEQVICGPGENAGVVDIGDNQAVIFKMESHNHPSFIEPYQGAATGVGGILRDVFTMGARPIALMNALRFGSPDHPRTRHLVSGVVSGIGGYGNCVGVPTIGGETNFDEAYNNNNLVNAMAVGLTEQDKIFYSAAAGVGNPVLYVGARTGRDGIHGATMASAEFDDDSAEKRPTVQVGDPLTEKLLIEACLELMQTDAIIAIQDMGAAGLTCSSLEMAGKGELGIELNLDEVPQRENGMTPYEIMLSESQERMLMVIKPEREALAFEIFRKWELEVAVVGTLTETGRMVLHSGGEEVADVPIAPISTASPVLDRPYEIVTEAKTPAPASSILQLPPDHGKEANATIADWMERLLGSPNLSSKRWIWEQYDHQVMNDTLSKPGSDAALVRVHGTQKALAISTDCTPRYCAANPVDGGKQAVAECWRNLSASGATPLAITNCLNFGNPEKPEIMGQVVGALQGMAEACAGLSFPVVSGNVSLYNETNGRGILPTPAIGGIGLLEDLDQQCHIALPEAGAYILLIGEGGEHLSNTMAQQVIAGTRGGTAPTVDLAAEKRHGDFVRAMIGAKRITACHDITDGGLLIALAEMMIAGQTGASLELTPAQYSADYLFGEDQARYLAVVSEQAYQPVIEAAAKGQIPLTTLGKTGGDGLVINEELVITTGALQAAHESWLPAYMDGSVAAA